MVQRAIRQPHRAAVYSRRLENRRRSAAGARRQTGKVTPMDILQFLLHRVAFFGLPSGEVQRIRAGVEAGQSWADVCGDIAASLEQLAEDCEAVGRRPSAAQAWRGTACALPA